MYYCTVQHETILASTTKKNALNFTDLKVTLKRVDSFTGYVKLTKSKCQVRTYSSNVAFAALGLLLVSTHSKKMNASKSFAFS
jgi:hypothetical protein